MIKILSVTGIAIFPGACGGGGSGATGSSGITLDITDAPAVDADITEVWVRFTQVIVHPVDGSRDVVFDVIDNTDPNDVKP